jgi:hypothetical protein
MRLSFILGTDQNGLLVCPDRARFYDHCSILGNPGTGKSNMCLNLMAQAVLRPDPDVRLIVYIDMKGDPVVRNWLGEHVPDGWRFIYFTHTEDHASVTYNPLAHILRRFQTPSARNDALCGRLGISKASKETFFPHLNMALGLAAWEKVARDNIEVKGFAQLHGLLEAIRDANEDRYKHATDILNRVKALAAMPRLADQPGVDALDVPDLFTRPTILCVNLPVLEGTNAPEYVAKCLLSDLVLSAKRRRALLFCDEAHRLLNSRETLLVAEQARQFGIGIVLAAQSSEQYQAEDGKPLGWLVAKLTRVRIQFSPNTVDDLKQYMVLSGLNDVPRTSTTISTRPAMDGFGPVVTESVTTFDDRETRIGLNDLLDHSGRPMNFVLQIDHDEHYGRPTLVHGPWPLTKSEYERLTVKPWPAPQVNVLPAPPLPSSGEEASAAKGLEEQSDALKACEQAVLKPPKKESSRRKKKPPKKESSRRKKKP